MSLVSNEFHGLNKGIKVSKGAKIRNRYNQVPHLTQDTNGKVTNSQIDANRKFYFDMIFTNLEHKHGTWKYANNFIL